MVRAYNAIVKQQEAPSDSQNPKLCRSMAGSTRNMGKLGKTYQNVDSACTAIRSTSAVSRQSQMMASTDIKGSDAIRPPIPGLRCATSDTIMTKTPDRAALRIRYVTTISVPQPALHGGPV
jgi:hypothetical protein